MENEGKMIVKIKVFQLNDHDFWAAENLDEAKSDYLWQTGCDIDEAFDISKLK